MALWTQFLDPRISIPFLEARELKSVYVDVVAQFLRIVFHKRLTQLVTYHDVEWPVEQSKNQLIDEYRLGDYYGLFQPNLPKILGIIRSMGKTIDQSSYGHGFGARCHVNRYNALNQVGLIALSCLGEAGSQKSMETRTDSLTKYQQKFCPSKTLGARLAA